MPKITIVTIRMMIKVVSDEELEPPLVEVDVVVEVIDAFVGALVEGDMLGAKVEATGDKEGEIEGYLCEQVPRKERQGSSHENVESLEVAAL